MSIMALADIVTLTCIVNITRQLTARVHVLAMYVNISVEVRRELLITWGSSHRHCEAPNVGARD